MDAAIGAPPLGDGAPAPAAAPGWRERVKAWSVLAVLFGSFGYGFVYVTEPGCSSARVVNSVLDAVERRIARATKFSVGLVGIRPTRRLVGIDVDCAAEVTIDGRPTGREVEYSWEDYRGRVARVHVTLRPG